MREVGEDLCCSGELLGFLSSVLYKQLKCFLTDLSVGYGSIVTLVHRKHR